MQSGGEKNKTDRLNSEDKSLSAHPASIWAPAAANVKWIQHFPSHYPFSLHWSAPIGSNQPANQPFNWSYFLIVVILKGSVCSFLSLWLTVCLITQHWTTSDVFHTLLIAICVSHRLLPVLSTIVTNGDVGGGNLEPLIDQWRLVFTDILSNIYTWPSGPAPGRSWLTRSWQDRERQVQTWQRKEKGPVVLQFEEIPFH